MRNKTTNSNLLKRTSAALQSNVTRIHFRRNGRDLLESKAVLLGAVGHPKYDHLPPAERAEGGLLKMRKVLGNYANLRPVTVPEALVDSSPLRREVVQGADIVIVRELLGGIYFGTPRGMEKDHAFNTEIYSREEVRRVAKVAFRLAHASPQMGKFGG